MERTLSSNGIAERSLWAPMRRFFDELLRPPSPSARVASAIREAEATSEIVVGWLQLGGVAMFAVLYLATIFAFHDRGVFEPVPVALAVYGVFVAWRLRRAYAGTLTPTLLSVSAAADVCVLIALIWGFTLQYQAPAAIYLKSPTFSYLFLLIALRALRFDAGHVLLTGVFAIVGWIGLTIVAARGAPIVNDYPTYMTSLSVLWGAEAEKIAALAGVTLTLALAVSRARNLLVRTEVEEAAARDLSRFLDPTAARRVRAASTELKAGDGELKPMAIMFIDLRGFSAAAATLSPSAVIALLQEYQSRFVPVVEAAGGSVDKFLGDGILVSFGGGERVGAEAARAFAAVPTLLKTADDWADERRRRGAPALDVAVAITHGEVVHGVIGHGDRLEFTVIGEAVNLAAKLEKHAKAERARVIASRDAYDQAVAQGAQPSLLRAASGARVEGAPEPVDLVILA